MRTSIDKRIQKGLDASYEEETTTTIQVVIQQLEQYFSGDRTTFDLPLQLVGTPFQKEVWNVLLKILYGQTESYLGLSRKLQNEKAIRAVASANGANAISIIVPCHRIVGHKGELVGYAGGIRTKQKLLNLESPGHTPEQLELF